METRREDFAVVLRSAQRREIRKALCTWSSVLICLSSKGRDFSKVDTCFISSPPQEALWQQRTGCASRAGRTRGPWPPFPAHIALCRSLCSRMVVPGWPSVADLQRGGTHRASDALPEDWQSSVPFMRFRRQMWELSDGDKHRHQARFGARQPLRCDGQCQQACTSLPSCFKGSVRNKRE